MVALMLWVTLTLCGSLLLALLVWRYQIGAMQARRRRRGRSLLNYLDRN
jgi:hypothetical protein